MTMTCTRMGWVDASVAQAAAPETSSDEMLIRRIADGDQLAMRTLFGRHRVPLYRWLLRLVGDEALAEDLLSDVFLDVWRQAATFEARSSVSTWLLAIARYKALSARRRRPDVALDETIASSVADPADDPEVMLQKKNRAELLPLLGSAVAGARRGHRPRLLPRQIGQRGRGDRRDRRGHCEDAHVLRAQEVGGGRCDGLDSAALLSGTETRLCWMPTRSDSSAA
jgi:DNA-directed RNA polymerase specialized sigma24 family protein